MWVLQALAIMLSIQAGTLDLVEPPPVVNNLPVALPAPLNLPVGLPSSPVLKGPANNQVLPPKRPVAPSRGGKCAPVARYYLSSEKIHEYLMNTLPPQIEDMVKCDEVNLEGLVGAVLDTVGHSDLLSILDITSLLGGVGGLGLGGLLGKEGNEDSSKPSSGSKATGGLGQLIPEGLPGNQLLGGLLNLGGDKGPGKGMLNGQGLSELTKPLDGIVEDVSNLKGSVEDKVRDMVPESIKEPITDLLKMDIKDTLLELKVSQVSVDSTEITMGADEIEVLSSVTANIEGKGLLGTVVTLLQFQSSLDVIMKIAVSSNNTQCVNLDVQDTHMHVKEMNINLVKTVTETVPLPLPLPLNEVIPVVLTAKINENLEKSNSCAIVLNDFNECKNTTGLFSYQVHTTRISPKGLAILYCAKANIGNKTVPVPGGRLPPDPKNASIAVTISSSTLKTLVKHVAKQSSVQMSGLEAQITHIVLASQENNVLRVLYKVDIRKDGENFATGETKLFISHGSKISNSKLVPDIKLTRSEHSVVPPEAKAEVEDIMSEVTKKAWSKFNELHKKMNIPDGVTSNTLTNSNVKLLRSLPLVTEVTSNGHCSSSTWSAAATTASAKFAKLPPCELCRCRPPK
ncbi:vomeromodulin-like [Grammomys surdaster]|uniref:vomeromodulin-like n=1 Tax=Grammomys surdaster TaxID=491861 RepID=UPI0010A09E2C|nr:vomeromodulin-like [Grammomys surdaster]